MPTYNKFLPNNKITAFDFDPDATTATEIGWVSMKDFQRIVFMFTRTVGTSDLTWRVLANAASDGSGTDVVVATKTVDPDAVADLALQEIDAKQIVQAAEAAGVADVEYVTLELAFATGTDEGVVHYIQTDPRFAYDGLGGDVIA